MYEKIEKLLKDRGISAYRMCKDTGLSRSLVSQWKNGSFNPKHDKLELLADYFDVPVSFFYEADPIFNVSAGTGTLNEDYDDAPKQSKDSSLVRVVGESMLPSLHDGDIVRVNHSFEISDIRDSDFVCVKINGFEDCINSVRTASFFKSHRTVGISTLSACFKVSLKYRNCSDLYRFNPHYPYQSG